MQERSKVSEKRVLVQNRLISGGLSGSRTKVFGQRWSDWTSRRNWGKKSSPTLSSIVDHIWTWAHRGCQQGA